MTKTNFIPYENHFSTFVFFAKHRARNDFAKKRSGQDENSSREDEYSWIEDENLWSEEENLLTDS